MNNLLRNAFTLFNRYRNNDLFWLICIFVFVAAIMGMIPIAGIPDGKDLSQHLQFALTYYNAITAGDFFPGWGADENYGFGSVGIRFYPPIVYYLLAFTRILAGNWYDAVWINFLFWMFIGCVGVYYWAKEWLSPAESAFAAVLYAIVPYHLSQIFQLMLIAEFAAAGILPFCFLFATRICARNTWLDVIFLGVSYALLLLTHIPSAITGSIGLGIYALLMIERNNFKKTFIQLFTSLVLALAAAAFHWVKLVSEINLVKHNESQFSSGYYDFKYYLFPMLFNAGEKYQQRSLWYFDVSIILTLFLALPVVVCLILKFKKKTEKDYERKIFLALSVTAFTAFFLLSSASAFVWSSVSFLQKVQFPWRWLSIFSLIAVISFSLGTRYLFLNFSKLKKFFAYAVLFLIFSVILFDLTQTLIFSEPIHRANFEKKVVEIQNESGCACWWTVWAKSESFERREKLSAQGRGISVLSWEGERREFTVEAGQPISIRAATFYYPHWKAIVNGFPIQIEKDENGTILIPVQSEKSSVLLYFEEPFKVKISLIISVTTWILLLGAIITFYLKRRNTTL